MENINLPDAMKKFFVSVMLSAAAALAFSSCSNIEPASEQPEVSGKMVTFNITASTPETKTVFGDKSGSSYPTKWTTSKDVCFSLNSTRNGICCNPTLKEEGKKADFSPTFTGSIATSGTIYAFSPVGNYYSSPKVPGFTSFIDGEDSIYLNIPSEQTPLANSVDESAQVLVASQTYTDSNTTISMSFHHLLAYGKMTITNFSGTIKSVELKFPENVVGPSCQYAYKEGAIRSLSGNSIILNPEYVADNTFWFSLAPTAGTTGKMYIIITDDSDGTYTKVLDLTSKSLPFEKGKISTFTVNFSGITKDVDYVTLPWNWDGGEGKDAFTAVAGVSATGLGDDYAASSSPYLIKMDSDGDNFIIKTDSAIKNISIDVKLNTYTTNTSLAVYGSSDGVNFEDIQTLSINGDANSTHTLVTTNDFEIAHRYVKVVFTKGGSNIGVGPISIAKVDGTPTCADPVISFENPVFTISCDTYKAHIFYTLDDTDPTSESNEYSAPYTLSQTKTVKAIAIKTGYNNSKIVSKVCEFSTPATITCYATLSVVKAGGSGTINVSYENAADYSVAVYSDSEHTSSSSWLTASFDASYNVSWEAAANTDLERKAYVVITVQNNNAAVTQKEIVVTQAAGAIKWTYEVTVESPDFKSDKEVTLNGATWSIVMGEKVGEPTYNGTKGTASGVYCWKWGNSKEKYWKSYTISTDFFSEKKVKSVTVNFYNYGSKEATMTVKQGETTIGTQTATFGQVWTDLVANSNEGTGGTLSIGYSVAQASYIHSITVIYMD